MTSSRSAEHGILSSLTLHPLPQKSALLLILKTMATTLALRFHIVLDLLPLDFLIRTTTLDQSQIF